MALIIRGYRLVNLLSIDVVAGAVISAIFFARIFQVSIRPYGLIALGLTVWIIYTTDHLRDARKITGLAATKRHRFHQVHYKKLTTLLAVAVIADIIVIFFIRQRVFEWGVVLSLVVLTYLFVHRSLAIFKEVLIAVLYTCGVLLPSVPVSNTVWHASHYLLIVQFGIVALTNLFMFSWFDREFDKQDNLNSIVMSAGEPVTRKSIWYLFVSGGLLTLLQCLWGDLTIPALILGLMGLLLLLIFLFRSNFAGNDYYRFLGDAVFFIPIIFLL
jgi:hypothetical protein